MDLVKHGLRVRPLIWEGSAKDFYLHATTQFGIYEISVEYGDEWFCDYCDHRTGRPVRLSGYKDGPVVPQSAAQADYDARIIAALKAIE